MPPEDVCEFAITRTAEYLVGAPDPVFGTTTAKALLSGRVRGRRINGRFTWNDDRSTPAGILAEPLARGEITTDDGALVSFRVAAMSLPQAHGQRPVEVLTIHFETGDARYAWLRDRMFMADATRHPTGEFAHLRVYRSDFRL